MAIGLSGRMQYITVSRFSPYNNYAATFPSIAGRDVSRENKSTTFLSPWTTFRIDPKHPSVTSLWLHNTYLLGSCLHHLVWVLVSLNKVRTTVSIAIQCIEQSYILSQLCLPSARFLWYGADGEREGYTNTHSSIGVEFVQLYSQ